MYIIILVCKETTNTYLRYLFFSKSVFNFVILHSTSRKHVTKKKNEIKKYNGIAVATRNKPPRGRHFEICFMHVLSSFIFLPFRAFMTMHIKSQIIIIVIIIIIKSIGGCPYSFYEMILPTLGWYETVR